MLNSKALLSDILLCLTIQSHQNIVIIMSSINGAQTRYLYVLVLKIIQNTGIFNEY